MNVFELIVAVVLGGLGVRSLVRWMARRLISDSMIEQLLFLLHATARVGMWFAVAAMFAGYALLDEPQHLRGYLLLLIALPAIQLLTGFALSRSPGPSVVEERPRVAERRAGNGNGHDRGEPDAGSPRAGEVGPDVRSRPPAAPGG